jgi:hypothetical protein
MEDDACFVECEGETTLLLVPLAPRKLGGIGALEGVQFPSVFQLDL